METTEIVLISWNVDFYHSIEDLYFAKKHL